MGRKSTKANKNIYQTSRESLGLTREAAAEILGFISEDRIEKIESEKTLPHPEEILAMADGYKNPSLCNYFCSQVCPIGQKYVPKVKVKDLSQITVEMMVSLNNLNKNRDRLMEITVDGEITEDEMTDFCNIQNELDKISQTVDSLRLWVEGAIASGRIDKDLMERL
ncbi:MAG: helix-turn-helix transcriptional regulator [Lachnospiraceae bacterium]|nr:helix-turn-helix transcriptional regulator [Lachnospiraceae bacterium]